MTFHRILFDQEGVLQETTEQPTCFTDLNLDQVVETITAPKKEYNLKPFFYTLLRDVETVRYRQEVFRDLEDPNLMAAITAFARAMSQVRRYLGMIEKLDFDYHKKGWCLETALVYCDAVAQLTAHLSRAKVSSRGLRAFREYVTQYARSPEFQSLWTEAQEVKEALRSVKYCVVIQPGKFSVRAYEGESDYTVEIERTFAKFRQGAVKDYLADLRDTRGMNHIEAKILEFVARLHPQPFAALDQFCARHNPFVDEVLRRFDREIQFYVAYLEFIAGFKHQGLPFCYPEVSAHHKEEYVQDSFDLALANVLRHSQRPIVCNDFFLQGPERIIVVTGPNQGGKTTFARMFGQLHYLANLGCPVPAREARLFLCDQIFSHFEREEDIRNLRGKLQDDLVRTHEILAHATPNSILIVNEIFASTTFDDAVFLSRKIMDRVMALDVLCVWVTFIDELSRLTDKTVSMVSTVDPENPILRTFKIVRMPADGLAYALSVARKHRLTYAQLKERIQP